MKKCRTDFVRLEDALYAAKIQGAIVKCSGFKEDESIHYFDGKYFYEDGCYLGSSIVEVKEMFDTFFSVPEVSWYSEYSFADEDLLFLHGVHLCESGDLFKSTFLEYLEKSAINLRDEVC